MLRIQLTKKNTAESLVMGGGGGGGGCREGYKGKKCEL